VEICDLSQPAQPVGAGKRVCAAGSRKLPQSVQVVASGQRADGSKVESQAAYFARDSRVFQAVIYAGQLKPDMVEPFFSALKFE
jgi:hypothetical protein